MTVAGDFECQLRWLEKPTGQIEAQGNGCGRINPQRRWLRPEAIEVNASGSGVENGAMLTGTLPRGAELVRIDAKGREPVYLRAYDAGEKWQHRHFFVVNLPLVRPTTVTGLDASGRALDSYEESFI
jgi:hypothetical protein